MIEFSHVSYAYGHTHDALHDISFELAPGRCYAVVGANGSGKSTLARLAKGSLVPTNGTVMVDGIDTSAGPDEAWELARLVGFVRQDPRDQMVSASVFDEVAFGPANLGMELGAIRRVVGGALTDCGLTGYEGRSVEELSGGELQRLAFAGAVAMDPRYLVLDEVTAQLDSVATASVRSVVSRLVKAGCGVLEVTHDPAEALRADTVIVLAEGSVAWQGAPRDLLADQAALDIAGLSDDALVRICETLAAEGAGFDDGAVAADVARGALGRDHDVSGVSSVIDGWLDSFRDTEGLADEPGISLQDASVSYGDRAALRDVSLDVASGEVCLVAGLSGSGKSTMARLLAGVQAPDAGMAVLHGRKVRPGSVGLAFQRPGDQLFCDTVIDDVSFGPRNLDLPEDEVRRRAERALECLGVAREKWDVSPLSLSGGQARRVALAGVVSMEPDAYVLDEPTAGLDSAGRRFLHGAVADLARAGSPVIVVSHDVGEWMPCVDSVALVREGRLVWRGRALDLARDAAPFALAGLEAPTMVVLAGACMGEASVRG